MKSNQTQLSKGTQSQINNKLFQTQQRFQNSFIISHHYRFKLTSYSTSKVPTIITSLDPMKPIFSLSFALLLFISIIQATASITPQKMTNTYLQQLKAQQDYVHHIVFFNESTFTQFSQAYDEQLSQLSAHEDIKFYINDCRINPLQQCKTSDTIPLMLLFNRIFIRFNGGKGQGQVEQIYDWIVERIAMSPVVVGNKEELEGQLGRTPELFCYCNGQAYEKAVFYSLSKAMILTNYCVIENKTFVEELGLKPGNITLFKNGTLQHRIEFEYQNRYDIWEMFLKMNAINHIKKSEELVRKRFSQENKNIDATIVICDFSYKCEKLWMQFAEWSREFQKNHPAKELALTFFDQKQILLYNIYLHTKVNFTQFPALLNVKMLSENGKAGWFRRYLTYPEAVDEQTVLNFLEDIDSGKVQEVSLSAQIPAKNGFTGKNAQKLIQKLSAKTLNSTIQASQKHYVLLLSSFDMGIPDVEEFYKEYKKAASFLSEEDITFGYMDVMKNEVKIDDVSTIPQVLLYNKYLKDEPVRMGGRTDFDNLMRFLENNAIVNYSGEL